MLDASLSRQSLAFTQPGGQKTKGGGRVECTLPASPPPPVLFCGVRPAQRQCPRPENLEDCNKTQGITKPDWNEAFRVNPLPIPAQSEKDQWAGGKAESTLQANPPFSFSSGQPASPEPDQTARESGETVDSRSVVPTHT